MYDIIYNIVNHVWNNSTGYSSTEQQIIWYICGSLILILTTIFIDMIYRLVRGIFKKGDF